MEASINVLGQYKDRRRVAVLGEMLELGGTAAWLLPPLTKCCKMQAWRSFFAAAKT